MPLLAFGAFAIQSVLFVAESSSRDEFLLIAASSICLVAMFLLTAGQGAYLWLYKRKLQATENWGTPEGSWLKKGSGPLETAPKNTDFEVVQQVRPLSQQADRAPTTNSTNQVAIILCVRGNDPSLRECLLALDSQVWPAYQIIVGLDSTDDPAFALVQSFAAAASHPVTIHELEQIPREGSLKCAVLAEIVDSLDESIDAIALVDADSIVQPNWLETLATPLSDSTVGAVTGTRWFEPPMGNRIPFGTFVRAVWNTAAIVQMHLYTIAWGGSLSMRLKTIRELELSSHWRTMLCEDTCLTEKLRPAGLRIIQPPSLVVVNREVSTIPDVGSWLVRQLLTVRLYHPHWPLVAIHGLLVGSVTVFAMISLLAALVLGQVLVATILFTGFVAYTGLSWWMLQEVCRINNQWIPVSATCPDGLGIRKAWFSWITAIPVTQLVHLWATVRTIFATRIVWRNVVYRCHNNKIEIEEYLTFSRCSTLDDSIH